MHAIIRHYDGLDQNRTTELTGKVKETLVPRLEELPGFAGYWLIEAGNGVFSSLGLFETPEQSKESTNVVATWIREEKLETLIPNEPKITSGQVVAQRPRHGRLARPHRIRREGPAYRALSRFPPPPRRDQPEAGRAVAAGRASGGRRWSKIGGSGTHLRRPPTNEVGRIGGHGSKSGRGAAASPVVVYLVDDDPRASAALLSPRLGAVASRDAAEHVGERG